MNNKYQPQQFEKKWIEEWERSGVYKTPQLKVKKQYILDMFPYPSGAGLHVGHPRGYTATDILSRFYRMNGKTVLHPMGWDAFGLPAENAAIKAKKNPIDMVPKNIANFKRQMKMLGFSYDWDREFATTDPNYYKWTQWLFIQFFKMGLLYKKNIPINFCPKCKTGLAEEEVFTNGTHERCDTKIVKKELPQWLFRITTYADRLLEDLKGLDWPEGILTMQKNWIGKSKGVFLNFKTEINNYKIKVFTTAIDTVFGVTFMVLSPEHPLVSKLTTTKYKKSVNDYIATTNKKTELERISEEKNKTGVFSGSYCINPLNGKKVPVWVADYVLMSYGTGAVMGVPGHDARDYDFAKKYNFKVVPVIKPTKEIEKANIKIDGFWSYEEIKSNYLDKSALFNSDSFNGLNSKEAKEKLEKYIEEKQFGKKTITYHIRDWIFSRQRYWGEPIPMVYCEDCAKKKISYWEIEPGRAFLKQYQTIVNIDQTVKNSLFGWFPIDEKNLPLELPYVESYEPTDTGESPLAKIKDWIKTACPNCGKIGERETDTMPNWAGSCWYFIAFSFWDQIQEARQRVSRPPHPLRGPLHGETIQGEPKAIDSKQMSSPPSLFLNNLTMKQFNNDYVQKWLPVDWYFGGAEHAVLHLLYSRFWVKALYDLGLVKFKEPFLRLRNVGMVLAEDHKKMSKSLGNVINPDDVVNEYGADSLRLYEMFMAPFSQEIAWSTQTLQGVYRFLNRVWLIYHQAYEKNSDRTEAVEDPDVTSGGKTASVNEGNNLIIKLNKTIDKVTKDIQDIKYNTAIAAMMEFLNEWESKSQIQNNETMKQFNNQTKSNRNMMLNQPLSIENARKFLQILAPFAPFTTEEIWHEVFGEKQSIHLSSWPTVNKKDLIDKEFKIPVQVNGKVRTVLTISATDASEKSVIEKALADQNVKKYLTDQKYTSIYIPNKILNFITN